MIVNETDHPVAAKSYYFYNKQLMFLPLSLRQEGQREAEAKGFQDDSVVFSPPAEPPESRVLQSGDALYSFRWIGADYAGAHPFSTPGRYLVAAGGWDYNQVSARLEVAEPSGADAEALKDLEAQKLFVFFTPRSVIESLEREYDRLSPQGQEEDRGALRQQVLSDVNRRLQAFVVKHPRSIYADWAKWGLLLVQMSPNGQEWPRIWGRISNEYLPEAKRTRREYELLAPSLFPYLRANALFRAGVLAILTGDGAEGETLLNNAVALRADATMEKQVELFRQQIKEVPGFINKPAAPQIPTAYDIIKRQLEAERYDLRGLDKDITRRSEYDFKFLQLLAKRDRKEITDGDYYEALAKLFDFYIRTYTKPLSPEEWERLQTERKHSP